MQSKATQPSLPIIEIISGNKISHFDGIESRGPDSVIKQGRISLVIPFSSRDFFSRSEAFYGSIERSLESVLSATSSFQDLFPSEPGYSEKCYVLDATVETYTHDAPFSINFGNSVSKMVLRTMDSLHLISLNQDISESLKTAEPHFDYTLDSYLTPTQLRREEIDEKESLDDRLLRKRVKEQTCGELDERRTLNHGGALLATCVNIYGALSKETLEEVYFAVPKTSKQTMVVYEASVLGLHIKSFLKARFVTSPKEYEQASVHLLRVPSVLVENSVSEILRKTAIIQKNLLASIRDLKLWFSIAQHLSPCIYDDVTDEIFFKIDQVKLDASRVFTLRMDLSFIVQYFKNPKPNTASILPLTACRWLYSIYDKEHVSMSNGKILRPDVTAYIHPFMVDREAAASSSPPESQLLPVITSEEPVSRSKSSNQRTVSQTKRDRSSSTLASSSSSSSHEPDYTNRAPGMGLRTSRHDLEDD